MPSTTNVRWSAARQRLLNAAISNSKLLMLLTALNELAAQHEKGAAAKDRAEDAKRIKETLLYRDFLLLTAFSTDLFEYAECQRIFAL